MDYLFALLPYRFGTYIYAKKKNQTEQKCNQNVDQLTNWNGTQNIGLGAPTKR